MSESLITSPLYVASICNVRQQHSTHPWCYSALYVYIYLNKFKQPSLHVHTHTLPWIGVGSCHPLVQPCACYSDSWTSSVTFTSPATNKEVWTCHRSGVRICSRDRGVNFDLWRRQSSDFRFMRTCLRVAAFPGYVPSLPVPIIVWLRGT